MEVVAEAGVQFTYRTVGRKIVSAFDCVARLGDYIDELKCRRALIICGPNVRARSGIIERVQAAIGNRYAGIFDQTGAHAPLPAVERGAKAALELDADVLVAVGGGSTQSVAKLVAVQMDLPGSIRDFRMLVERADKMHLPELPTPRVPVIAIPTTFPGAEFTASASGVDPRVGTKVHFGSATLAPRMVLLDTQALATTPLQILLGSAFVSVDHCIEIVCSRRHNPIADALALAGLRKLMHIVPKCADAGLAVLQEAQVAAVLPMLVLQSTGTGVVHALAHHVGDLHHVSHGAAHGILAPHGMRFNLDASLDQQVLVAEAVGINVRACSPREACLAAANAVAALARSLGLPSRLRDVGVPETGLDAIADETMLDRQLPSNPRPIAGSGDLLPLLQAAW
ncbi:MAG: iron-containing alcohol dehydrogenase [Betaproteobacteria bacterium]|nr:iron-containing alcohol dehydrogenase [Betaproteobacteria bacterium]